MSSRHMNNLQAARIDLEQGANPQWEAPDSLASGVAFAWLEVTGLFKSHAPPPQSGSLFTLQSQ